uniref:Uncharacterized protein n=1 Tax=Marseillevirus sp. TaxID=2809551 RepID=A0AA96EP05_9VIRU|nr:hypothetical protein MarFTMF_518 [Marseillevirus sp.]
MQGSDPKILAKNYMVECFRDGRKVDIELIKSWGVSDDEIARICMDIQRQNAREMDDIIDRLLERERRKEECILF